MDHVRMQAAAQGITAQPEHQCAGRSTFNRSKTSTWPRGIRAAKAATYRPNEVTGSVLSVSGDTKPEDRR
jgi:hypothetical protein